MKSRLSVHLVVRGMNYEFSVDAPALQIAHDLEDLKKLNSSIAKTLSGVVSTPVQIPGPELAFEDVPAIKAARSTMDNIVALFGTDWARKPRTVADVVKALEANAVPDTTTASSVYLTRLVKKGTLRRIRKAGKYQYYRVPSG